MLYTFVSPYPSCPWSVLFPVVQHFGRDLLNAIGLGFTDRSPKDGNKIFHLRFGQSGTQYKGKEFVLSP